MFERDGYPAGVPCWIDLVQPDFDRMVEFYGELFDWTFDIRTPADAPARYAYALRDGLVVAGVGSPPMPGADPAGWTNYVCVDSADDAAAAVVDNGGTVVAPPIDIPDAGRVALCADPHGAPIGLWQPRENRGAQMVNAAGSWNFSALHTPDADRSVAFYGAVFGWGCDPIELAPGQKVWLWRLPGYGDFLAERDPEVRERQEQNEAPDGFADAVAWMEPGTPEQRPYWTVTFAVADADVTFQRALDLGATVVTPLADTPYTREGMVRDPQGDSLILSEYRPPEPS